MKNLQTLFNRLSSSQYRASFQLHKLEVFYLQKRGLPNVMKEGRDFIERRLQKTHQIEKIPSSGHPIFVALYATAMNDRESLLKWHGIPANRNLLPIEIDYMLSLLEYWITEQEVYSTSKIDPAQTSLF